MSQELPPGGSLGTESRVPVPGSVDTPAQKGPDVIGLLTLEEIFPEDTFATKGGWIMDVGGLR